MERGPLRPLEGPSELYKALTGLIRPLRGLIRPLRGWGAGLQPDDFGARQLLLKQASQVSHAFGFHGLLGIEAYQVLSSRKYTPLKGLIRPLRAL